MMFATAASHAELPLVPLPAKVELLPGPGFVLTKDTEVVVPARDASKEAEALAATLRRSTGFPLRITAPKAPPGIGMNLNAPALRRWGVLLWDGPVKPDYESVFTRSRLDSRDPARTSAPVRASPAWNDQTSPANPMRVGTRPAAPTIAETTSWTPAAVAASR